MDVGDYSHGGYKVVVVASLLIFMSLLMVGGRLLGRHLQKVWLGIDDYVLILATVFTVTLCAVSIAFPRIAGVTNWSLERMSNSQTIGQASIAWRVLYGASVALSKVAILLLYLRVFTAQMRSFTIALILVGIVVMGAGAANTLGTILQCSPIPYAWDKTTGGGKCINDLAFARFMAIPNVVDGFVMLVMPLPLVWRLDLAIQQKIALTATFLHGIVGFAASIARLAILFQTDPHTSPSTSSTTIIWTIWTINEPTNYIIAACLPTLRPILVRIFPEQLFILTRKRDSTNKHELDNLGNAKTPGLSPRESDEQQAQTRGRAAWSWWGKMTPKLTLASRGKSRLTGPWDRSQWEDEEVGRGRTLEREQVVVQEKALEQEKAVQIREEEFVMSH